MPNVLVRDLLTGVVNNSGNTKLIERTNASLTEAAETQIDKRLVGSVQKCIALLAQATTEGLNPGQTQALKSLMAKVPFNLAIDPARTGTVEVFTKTLEARRGEGAVAVGGLPSN